MSADNWAECPRCVRRYPLSSDNDTFREDYEFYGAEDGVVVATYSGYCTNCGLSLKFEDRHPIPGVDE